MTIASLLIPFEEFCPTFLLMELLVAFYKLVGSHTDVDTSSEQEEGSTAVVGTYSTMEALAGNIKAFEPSSTESSLVYLQELPVVHSYTLEKCLRYKDEVQVRSCH